MNSIICTKCKFGTNIEDLEKKENKYSVYYTCKNCGEVILTFSNKKGVKRTNKHIKQVKKGYKKQHKTITNKTEIKTMKSGLICKCGKEIEITVPMYVDKNDNYVCKECFEKIKH